jgi:signal transduction histidine kinase
VRHVDDVQLITPLVWKELTVLGLPFFRCGVFIMDEKEKTVHIYLSTPDGKPLAVLHLAFDHSEFIGDIVKNWQLQQVMTTHWDRGQFIAWVNSLIGEGQIKTAAAYQGGDAPPESLTLQLIPFAQGMLYTGSVETLSDTQIELVKALAEAFSAAYARYEDFKKLEDAKSIVESTLEELKATQAQLVQREKMASLGELTAGIAHEIQNPLNFINNFSEVNRELLAELEQEIDRRNFDEVKTIASDLKANEDKITHHGKRADSIVKSMLQHSRKSDGTKELTDINALADEYLRLAYHGTRAKDKSFYADVETCFDEAVDHAAVVPQDIGRVLLNLYTNAFYAVTEKKKQLKEAFKPMVSVQTKKAGQHILITVKDNGTGIPQKALDKIFQPFFTTKPAGKGTGLGLSLSYDIITKGHGGELRVDSKEGEGATFQISLPVASHKISSVTINA